MEQPGEVTKKGCFQQEQLTKLALSNLLQNKVMSSIFTEAMFRHTLLLFQRIHFQHEEVLIFAEFF